MAAWSASPLLIHSAAAVPRPQLAGRSPGPAAACSQSFRSRHLPLAPLPVLLIILPSASSPSLGVEIPSSSLLVLVFLISSLHF